VPLPAAKIDLTGADLKPTYLKSNRRQNPSIAPTAHNTRECGNFVLMILLRAVASCLVRSPPCVGFSPPSTPRSEPPSQTFFDNRV
jgi:hypothetical protein